MLELTAQQRDIRQAAREFAEGEFVDIAAEHDERGIFPWEVWKKACEAGFVGAFIQEKHEGAGLGMLECALILEEFWRVDPGCGNVFLATLGAEFIQDFGSEDQMSLYLPPLTKAEGIIGTVPGEDYIHDSYNFHKLDDSNYVLNGRSKFVVNGTIADHVVLIAEDRQTHGRGRGQFSTFIIDKKLKGVKTIEFSDRLGVRASDLGEVRLEDVRVPPANLVGSEGHGLVQFEAFLDRLCIYNSAQAIGASQGCLERAVKYSKQRVQFGHPIGWFQMIQFKIAEMATRIEAARSMCHHAARQFDHGRKDRKTLSMASWFSRETSSVAAAETLQIHGGYGYMNELDIQRFYRDVQFVEFFGASREREKLRVAEELLGRTTTSGKS
jgi:alkylation response protein AidB-like acyl-CoA dehydrogenase